MCQNLQVQVEELKSVNESLNLSVEELSKACALVEATLKERDEMISAQYLEYLVSSSQGCWMKTMDNYQLKDSRLSTQCHTQNFMWDNLRGVVHLILLMDYKFKFDISGLLHQVNRDKAYQNTVEPLEYMNIHDNDASESLRPSWGKMCTSGYYVNFQWFVKYSANMRRTDADFSHAPPNEYSPSPDDKKQ
ncbi:hypothetical protein Tco_0233151 [Tanacetum coccineum]